MKSKPPLEAGRNPQIEVSPQQDGAALGLPRRVGAKILHALREGSPAKTDKSVAAK